LSQRNIPEVIPDSSRNLLKRKDKAPPEAQTRGMTTKRLLAFLVIGMVGTLAFARARRPAPLDGASRAFEVRGVVTAAPADGHVTLAHDAIAGYMPAMTMSFGVAEGAPALAAGDRVRFTLRVGADWSRAEAFVVEGRDDTVARAAAVAAGETRQRLKKRDALPAFALTTQAGGAFTAADLNGRLTAVTFIYTRCPVPEFCPLMSKRFQQVQRELERDPRLRDVQLLSVTLDPGFDTPPVLDAYAKAMGADPERWRFVTGDPSEVGRLTTAFSIHAERDGVLLDHTLATAVIDGQGRVAEIWRGNGWNASDVLDVLRREAARAGDRAASE
jgi:protein SCO1/2